MQKKILIIETTDICLSLTNEVAKKTAIITTAENFSEAKKILANDLFDLVVIDISVPDGNGLAFCSDLPYISKNPNVAVMVASNDGNIPNKVTAFSLGVIDYITKPFHPVEFKARIQRALKSKSVNSCIGNNHLRLFTDTLKAESFIDNKWTPLDLTLKEFLLLQMLINSVNKPLARQFILDTVWGAGVHVSERVIDTHMVGLRKKITPHGFSIESIRGVGYRLVEHFDSSQKAS